MAPRAPSRNQPLVEGAAAPGAPPPAGSSAPARSTAAPGRLRILRSGERQTAAATIRRDYGYVRGELLRIAILAGAIFVVLGLIAVIRG